MSKEEFEVLLGEEVSHSYYQEIELVYQWHPSIQDVGGKEQLIALFCEGGMPLIRSLKEDALLARDFEAEQDKIMGQLALLEERQSRIKEGEFMTERCIRDMRCAYSSCKELEQVLFFLETLYGTDVVRESQEFLGMKSI